MSSTAKVLAIAIIVICVFADLQPSSVTSNADRFRPAPPTPAVVAADPLPHLGSLKGIPTFLLYDNADHVVPPATNEIPAAAMLGARCRAIVFQGTNHVDPRVYDPALVDRLLAHVPRDVPVILLHGWGATGADWFYVAPSERGELHTLAAFGSGLKSYGRDCRSADFGGNAWGNNDAVQQLEDFTRSDRKVVLIASSMGGSLMFRYAERHPNKVTAMVGLSPVCSLEAMCHTRLGADIVRAYGGSRQ